MSLVEIVQTVGLPKTTVFRILSSLVARGFCEWDATGEKYSLGFELVRLADIRRRQSNVHDVAIPVMREIRNAVNETVILSVRSGDSRVHIDFAEGLQPMRRMADLGVRAPLYAGAASKVLLAGMADDEIEAYLDRTDLTAFQKSTITDRNMLWREGRIGSIVSKCCSMAPAASRRGSAIVPRLRLRRRRRGGHVRKAWWKP